MFRRFLSADSFGGDAAREGFLLEQTHAAHTTVQHVEQHTPGSNSGGSWHTESLSGRPTLKKRTCHAFQHPLLLTLVAVPVVYSFLNDLGASFRRGRTPLSETNLG
jgi:hypothetical protein